MVPAPVTASVFATAPFDMRAALAFLGRFVPVRGDQEVGDDRLRKGFATEGRAVVYELRQLGDVDAPKLQLAVWADGGADDATREAAGRAAATLLSTDDDLAPFYALAREDRVLAPIVDELYGLHHVKFPSAFEAAVWAVLAARCPMPVARRMKERLVDRFGPALTVDGTTHRAFPTVDLIAGAGDDELLELIGNRRRAGYVRAVIDAFSGADVEWLQTAPWEEADAWLREIKGVGEWSSAFVLLRGLGRMERMPLTMKPMLKAVESFYGPDEPPARIADRYGEWLGYWAFYLRVAEGIHARRARATGRPAQGASRKAR